MYRTPQDPPEWEHLHQRNVVTVRCNRQKILFLSNKCTSFNKEELNKEEQNIMTFSAVLLGIGEQDSFKEAYENLGFHALAELGDDIRKAVNIISSSVSSVSNGQNVSQDVNF